jgi:hypothetical protein
LFFDAKGHLKVFPFTVFSHLLVRIYRFFWHRLVIMEHLQYIVSLGKKQCTCLVVSVEASPTSHRSSS